MISELNIDPYSDIDSNAVARKLNEVIRALNAAEEKPTCPDCGQEAHMVLSCTNRACDRYSHE